MREKVCVKDWEDLYRSSAILPRNHHNIFRRDAHRGCLSLVSLHCLASLRECQCPQLSYVAYLRWWHVVCACLRVCVCVSVCVLCFPRQPVSWLRCVLVCESGYLGCFPDVVQPLDRDLGDFFFVSEQMSVTACHHRCSLPGIAYFGLQFGSECWCSVHPPGRHGAAVPDTECVITCPGDSAQQCGGRLRNAAFALQLGAWISVSSWNLCKHD